MAVHLRDYQETLVQGIRSEMRQHRRVLGVAPTGAGKTVIFAYITTNASARGKRVVIVAHRQEIVEQISRALDGMGVRHGRIQPGHTMTDDNVQVGMVQTVARRLDRIPEPDLLVVDEAHHAVAGTWAKLADAWQTARILGVTATPQRLDGRGLGSAFDAMVMGPAMGDLISGGFLAGYDYLAPAQVADLSSVGTRMGDFAVDELAKAMDRSVVTGDAAAHYAKHLNGRPAIAFCVSVAHAEHVAEQFRSAGFRAASVDGSMDGPQRRDLIASIGDGRLNVLTSCDIISEGTDIPVVSGAILLRPTKSVGMFLQQVGRVLRVKPDGSRAVILDHVGNVHRHGLPDMEREWSLDTRKKKKSDATPVSTCKACFKVFAVGTSQPACVAEPDCLFGEREVKARELEHVEGELVAMDLAAFAALKAAPLRDLLTGNDTRARLEEIQKAKGYAKGWAWHVMQDQQSAFATVLAAEADRIGVENSSLPFGRLWSKMAIRLEHLDKRRADNGLPRLWTPKTNKIIKDVIAKYQSDVPNGLTESEISEIDHDCKRSDMHGLSLRVRNGSKVWQFERVVKGRKYNLWMGLADHLSLDDARRRTRLLNELVDQGIDPSHLRHNADDYQEVSVAHKNAVMLPEVRTKSAVAAVAA